MIRFFFSLTVFICLGAVAALFIGWEVAPLETQSRPLSALAQSYRDDYTLMVASGYLQDGDTVGAVDRLRQLDEPNIPLYVQTVTERFISSSRDIEKIRRLVALSVGLGRLTPPMQPFQQLAPLQQGGS